MNVSHTQKLNVYEKAEIRYQLVHGGKNSRKWITVQYSLPNDMHLLWKEAFLLYYKSVSTDQ